MNSSYINNLNESIKQIEEYIAKFKPTVNTTIPERTTKRQIIVNKKCKTNIYFGISHVLFVLIVWMEAC